METYLCIITTALVVTQIIRVIQNAIQLHRQHRMLKRDVEWVNAHYPTEEDFESQRTVFRLLREKLEKETE